MSVPAGSHLDDFRDAQPEPRDREAEDHAAVDAREARADHARHDAPFLVAGEYAMARTLAAVAPKPDPLDRILADVQHPAVAELARVLPVYEAAMAWRKAELTSEFLASQLLLLTLRDVCDRARGLGIGQRGGVR